MRRQSSDTHRPANHSGEAQSRSLFHTHLRGRHDRLPMNDVVINIVFNSLFYCQ